MATETTILVVDDEKEIADLVEIYLVSDGYRVVKANDAEEGLKLLNEYEIQLVLLDIMMPGMNGLEMCAKIRETRNIPIIMLSAKSADIDTMSQSPSIRLSSQRASRASCAAIRNLIRGAARKKTIRRKREKSQCADLSSTATITRYRSTARKSV